MLPKPLPNRRNLVLSKSLVDNRATVCATIEDLQREINGDRNVWVIGGASVLWTLRPYISLVYLSVFDSIQRADITLDTDRYLEDYEMLHRELHGDHMLKVYRRIA